MSMATRCTACGTVFRVVQDQLRVSEGWVRCGRCAEVFNAVEQMVEVAPADRPMATPTPTFEPCAAPPREGLIPALPQPAAKAVVVVETVAAEAEPYASIEAPEPVADIPAPTFIQQADRAARWQRPGVKAALWAGVMAGMIVLAGQVGMEYRDLIAARWPGSRAAFEPLCRMGNCRIEPPRMINALAVDSSGLVRVDGTSMYRLSVVLRNRAAMALAMPAIDLSLTDSQGRVIARRTIAASELGAASSTIAAVTELPLQATLGIPDRPVSGYTIEVFYP